MIRGLRGGAVPLLRDKMIPGLAMLGRGGGFVALQGVWVYFFEWSNVARCDGVAKGGRRGVR